MINRKITTTWVVSVGDWEKEFPTRKKAQEAERTQTVISTLQKLEVTFREVFPVRHKNTSKYHTYCIDCGELLFEYASIYDGHRNEKGDYVKRQDYHTLFNGHRCEECHCSAKNLFKNIKEFYLQETGEKIFIDLKACINLNQAQSETVLMIYKIVECWKNFKE